MLSNRASQLGAGLEVDLELGPPTTVQFPPFFCFWVAACGLSNSWLLLCSPSCLPLFSVVMGCVLVYWFFSHVILSHLSWVVCPLGQILLGGRLCLCTCLPCTGDSFKGSWGWSHSLACPAQELSASSYHQVSREPCNGESPFGDFHATVFPHRGAERMGFIRLQTSCLILDQFHAAPLLLWFYLVKSVA